MMERIGGTAKERNEPGKRGGGKEGQDLLWEDNTPVSGHILTTRFCVALINEGVWLQRETGCGRRTSQDGGDDEE